MIERRPALTVFAHVVLLGGVAMVALPIWLTFVASTHPTANILKAPIPVLPGDRLLENYATVLGYGVEGSGSGPVGRMMLNSLVMALGIAIGKIAISILSAFAIVYFRFPFRMLAFWIIFVTLMLPVEVRILPTFEVAADLGLLNSYLGLTVPLIASATATFLFRQFFLTVPDELTEAARIDGAGPLKFFWDILLPLSRTNIAALVRDPVHLRLEPVPLAAAGDHRREHVHDRDGHPAHGHRGRCRAAVELRHGGGDARHAAAGDRRPRHAALVRQGPDRAREVSRLMAEVVLR